VSIVPLRIGGGTRFKILEAMAMAKPVVSTSLGAEGIDAEHGRHLLLADEPRGVRRRGRARPRRLAARRPPGSEGRALVENVFSWQAAAEPLEQLYQELTVAR